MIGKTLAHYEIIAKIGKGGMGEVYKARDTRLDREVAIKVLAPDFAENTELRQRFEREARAISQLNHPNVCTLHDIGETGEEEKKALYLVMELIEGDSLLTRLEKGPMPLSEVYEVGEQIARALAAAHHRGIVHRDVKPGNIMLTKSGAKLLDFGLATEATGVAFSGLSGLTEMATEAMPLTTQGTVLGTFQYMSPEQLEGRQADARSDIFGLGAVLHEMATGNRAFQADSMPNLIAAIVTAQPEPISMISTTAPPALDHVVERCLAKDPDERWQSASDVASELRWVAESASQRGEDPGPVTKPRTRWAALTAAILGTIVVSVLAGIAVGGRFQDDSGSASEQLKRFALGLDPDYPMKMGWGALAIAPDGSSLAYIAESDGVSRIVRLGLEDFEPQPLEGTDDARYVFFSPDGQWLGFTAAGLLKKVPAQGGRIVEIGGAEQPSGASWGDDGWIYLGTWNGIRRIPENGGPFEQLVQTPEGQAGESYSELEVLPGGRALLYNVREQGGRFPPEDWHLHLLALDDLQSTRLVEDVVSGRYVASGHLLYSRAGDLLAVPFDRERLEITGSEFTVRELHMDKSSPPVGWATSQSGLLAYIPVVPYRDDRSLVWVDHTGKETAIPAPTRSYGHPRLSPDGLRIAVDIVDPIERTEDIWVFDLGRELLTQVTIHPTDDSHPLWLPGGRDLVFNSQRDGAVNIYRKRADGSGSVVRITADDTVRQWPLAVTPDGEWLAIDEYKTTVEQIVDLILARPEANGERRGLIETRLIEGNPTLSPDGQWMAYEQGVSRSNIFVERFPNLGQRLQISTDGGSAPLWSPDGSKIFYRNGSAVYAVPIEVGQEFGAGKPVLLFENDRILRDLRRNYDVSRDGQRFLMIKAGHPERTSSRISLVLDWFSDVSAAGTQETLTQ